MKRAFGILSVALLSVTTIATAQGGLGIKGGFSYGNVSNRGLLPGNLEERTGFAVGLAFGGGVGASSLLSLGLEGLYAQRGVISANDPDSRKLDYIDVPAYLQVAIPTPGIGPYAYAGPQVSFETRCRTNSGACPDTDRPMVSYAAVLGGGARFGTRGGLTIEGRYVYGLTDLKLSTVTSSDSYKTRSFLILAGLAF